MSRPLPCPDRCNVLLVGGGGREHALAWKLRQSSRLGDLWLTDGANAGLARLGRVMDEPFDLKNAFRISRWCDRHSINLVVVGPEAPLAAGAADILTTDKRLVFGPPKAGAQLEADKAFAKQLMRTAAIPTAEARVFRNADQAIAYVESREDTLVVKASGLAAGKGVIVCDSNEEAIDAVKRIMLQREFGEAGGAVVIEERLNGQEVSVLALTDGRSICTLPPCQDHKQVGEGDVGPNTGGMGAYCPTPVLDDATLERIEREVLIPAVDAMKRDGIQYRGVLYAGLMLTPGGPKVLEFNCRFGDPECQPLMMRLKGDLVEVLWATASGTLDDVDVSFDQRTACCVVMCSGGYPGEYKKGAVITGLDDFADQEDLVVFHAGTKQNADGKIVTNGGRVLGVTALADDLVSARNRANAACERIHFEGGFYRHDIGHRVLTASTTR